MSAISKALKKVQESRQYDQIQYVLSTSGSYANSSYLNAFRNDVLIADPLVSDEEQAAGPNSPQKTSMTILAVGVLMAVLISLTVIILAMIYAEIKQNKTLVLENNIKTQEKIIKIQDTKIKKLIANINQTKSISDSQIRDLKNHLKKETNDVQVQINNLASRSQDKYDSLKEVILYDKQEIDYLNNYTRKLNQKIEANSVTIGQVAANQAAASQASQAADQATSQLYGVTSATSSN